MLRGESRPAPPLHLLRRLATVPASDQFTTAITVGELIFVVRNGRHFEQVPGLVAENWIDVDERD